MMTNTILGLASFGLIIIFFVILQVTYAIAHCRLRRIKRRRGDAIEGEDTVEYQSSSFLGNMWYRMCFKIPVDVISFVVCRNDMEIKV